MPGWDSPLDFFEWDDLVLIEFSLICFLFPPSFLSPPPFFFFLFYLFRPFSLSPRNFRPATTLIRVLLVGQHTYQFFP